MAPLYKLATPKDCHNFDLKFVFTLISSYYTAPVIL